jgi:hypothetical protein
MTASSPRTKDERGEAKNRALMPLAAGSFALTTPIMDSGR